MAAAEDDERLLLLQASSPPYFWGNIPDEASFYASQGIRSTKSFRDSRSGGGGGGRIFTRSWEPAAAMIPPRALVFMIHGYGNDISWTFQSTAISLARSGFACFSLDLPGHGRSYGLRAFVPDVSAPLLECSHFFASVRRRPEHRGLRCFLYGESMGGALCLLLHLRRLHDLDDDGLGCFDGAVLVAPMCKISDQIRPRWPLPQLLRLAAAIMPALPAVPTEDLLERSVKVEWKRAIALANPMRYRGKPRLGTVAELLRATDELASRLTEVTLPFIVLHGSADVVTDPAASRSLYEASNSTDKTIKIYDGMLHSMLYGEPDDAVALVLADITDWLSQRCAGDGLHHHGTTS